MLAARLFTIFASLIATSNNAPLRICLRWFVSPCVICCRTPGLSRVKFSVVSRFSASLKMYHLPLGKRTGSVRSPTCIEPMNRPTRSEGNPFCLRSSSLANPISPPRWTELGSSLRARATVAKSAPLFNCWLMLSIFVFASASFLASSPATPCWLLSAGSTMIIASPTPRAFTNCCLLAL